MTATRASDLPVVALVHLDPSGDRLVPAWPTDLGEPTVDFGREDTGAVCLRATSGAACAVAFFFDGDRVENHFDDEPTTEAHRQAVIAWGEPTLRNLDEHVSRLDAAVYDDRTRAALLALAQGLPLQRSEPAGRDQGLPAPQRASERTARFLPAWAGIDEPDAMVRDVLTDLMHYADNRGLDFGYLVARAGDVWVDEIAEARG